MTSSHLATRLYTVASSLKGLATLMDDANDSPIAPLIRLIGEEVESCAEESEDYVSEVELDRLIHLRPYSEEWYAQFGEDTGGDDENPSSPDGSEGDGHGSPRSDDEDDKDNEEGSHE